MPTLLPKSLKTKLGGGSGRGGSPQQAGGSSPQLHVSFKEGTKPKGAQEATTKPSQEELDAELRASPACQRMSSAEREPEQDEDAGLKPSVDSVFARLDNASPDTLHAALGPAALDMHRPPQLEGVGSSTASSRRPSGPTTPGGAQPKKSRPRIDEWAAVDGGACPFQAPEMRPIKLTGIVSNHPVLKDGPISTSLIQRIDEARGLAWTISTEYALGKPSAKFEAEMTRYGAPRPLMYSSDPVTRIAEQTSVLRTDPHRWAARPVAEQAAEPEPKYEPSSDVSLGSSGGTTVLAGKEEGAVGKEEGPAGKGASEQAVAAKEEPGEAAGGAAGEAAARDAAGEAAASDAEASGRQARASLVTQGPT